MKRFLGVCLVLFSAACAAQSGADTGACEEAADLFEACTGLAAPAAILSACHAQDAEEVVEAGCDAVVEWADSDGKADGVSSTRLEGESCVFNFECEGALVCRPTSGVTFAPKTCRAKALATEYPESWCDHTWDCADASGVCARMSQCIAGPCPEHTITDDARVCILFEWTEVGGAVPPPPG
ncbi:MAG: hypothetical protein EXR73_12110 [Myxococcales bacterium]|nr:hypothetical protein [Myxococcales bacterium]